MGGYAQYVWTAFGVTAVVLISNILAARLRQRRTLEQMLVRFGRQAERRMGR